MNSMKILITSLRYTRRIPILPQIPIVFNSFQSNNTSLFNRQHCCMSILKKRNEEFVALRKEALKKMLDEYDEKESKKKKKKKTKKKAKVKPKKILRVSIIGNPNSGKSTLMNNLIGEKISAVSPKQQTTRENVLGVWTVEDTQIIFYDTPGIIEPRFKRLRNMNEELIMRALESMYEVDMVVVLFDATKPLSVMEHILEDVKRKKKKLIGTEFIAVVNKNDLVKPYSKVQHFVDEIDELGLFDEIFSISAMKMRGVEYFVNYLFNSAKEGEWEFKESVKTPLTKSQRVLEIIREKCYRRLNKEIPYQVGVQLTKFKELQNGDLLVDCDLLVLNKGQKKVVESALRYLHQRAALDIRKTFDCDVYLKYTVKIKPDCPDQDELNAISESVARRDKVDHNKDISQ